jgi:hypothetical protein
MYYSCLSLYTILLSHSISYSVVTVYMLFCCHSLYAVLLSKSICYSVVTVYMLFCCTAILSKFSYCSAVTVYILLCSHILYTVLLSVGTVKMLLRKVSFCRVSFWEMSWRLFLVAFRVQMNVCVPSLQTHSGLKVNKSIDCHQTDYLTLNLWVMYFKTFQNLSGAPL